MYGIDIYIDNCCEHTIKLLQAKLSENSPANSEYNINKLQHCSSLNEAIKKRKYNTFFCENWNSVGRYVVFFPKNDNNLTIKVRGFNVFGEILSSLGILLIFII